MSAFSFLTPEWLTNNTLVQTMERGISYYQKGRIISVVKRGEVIEGKVQGSKRYVQTIGVGETGEPVATCTCPYNSSGFCKHIVAVAMAAIDGHVELLNSETGSPEVQASDQAFFEEVFQASPKGLQAAFLKQAFSRKPAWRQAFLNFSESPPEQHLVDFKEVRDRIRDALLDMDISAQEVEVHTGKKGQPTEVAEHFLRRKLFQLFKPHHDHLTRRLKLGDLLNAHRIWLGMYEAISGLELPAHSDILLPDEYPSYLRWEWSQANVTILSHVSREILGPGLVRQLVTLFCDRWSHFESGADTRKPPIQYEVKDFEPWLMLMAADPISATFVKHRVEAYGWELGRLEAELTNVLKQE